MQVMFLQLVQREATSTPSLRLIPTIEEKGNWIVKLFDAVGLASFTVVGVIVAVEERCDPLLMDRFQAIDLCIA